MIRYEWQGDTLRHFNDDQLLAVVPAASLGDYRQTEPDAPDRPDAPDQPAPAVEGNGNDQA